MPPWHVLCCVVLFKKLILNDFPLSKKSKDSPIHSSENYINGFVILSNLQYHVQLTLEQYDMCLSDVQKKDSVCLLRPCLVRYKKYHQLK